MASMRNPTQSAKVSFVFALSLLFVGAMSAEQSNDSGDGGSVSRTLEETRITMDKWIETQQIISKERKDWPRCRVR